jgi:hypothetical protein
LIPFLSPAQVNIKPSTARYYLEIEDECIIRREKDSLQTLQISNLQEQILTKDKIIDTYESDRELYDLMDTTYSELFTLKEEENKKLKGKLRLNKLLIYLETVVIIILIL